MKILVIDNYDSFTFNLVQLIGRYTEDIIVKRNDRTSVEEIKKINPDKIVISPGPGKPEDSNLSLTVIEEFGKTIPILGVCLGMQGIGITFGATVNRAPELMHGKTSAVKHDNKTIFKDVPQNFKAARYHSLIVDRSTVPEELEITSETNNGIVMGLRHKVFPIEGIQFHPESILTDVGDLLIKNWLEQ